MIYAWILAALLAVGSIAAIKIQTVRLDYAKTQVETQKANNRILQQNNNELLAAIELNENALETCIAVNTANEQVNIAQMQRAAQAEANARRISEQAGIELDRIKAETNDKRETADDSCRTLTNTLPVYLINWVPTETN